MITLSIGSLFGQAFSPSTSPLYLLGNILSASEFSVLWAIFAHDGEGAGLWDYMTTTCMLSVIVYWGVCQGGVEILSCSQRVCFLSGLCWSQDSSRKHPYPNLRGSHVVADTAGQ